MDYLFCNATVITVDRENSVIKNAFLGVKDGKIAYLGKDAPAGFDVARRIDCKSMVLLPGFINAHTHIPMTLLRGYADDYSLDDWLHKHIFPAESKMDMAAVKAGATLGIAEMLASGTVSFSDTYFHAGAIAEAVSLSKIKANLARAITSFDAVVDMKTFTSAIEEAELFERWHMHADGKIRIDASVHAEYTSGPSLWEGLAAFAKEKDILMQVHLSETRVEHEKCIEKYKKTPAALFSQYGVFDVRTTAAHCVWVSEADMDILSEKGVSVAHNPVSNLKLASGIARVPEMAERGVNIALGTDGTASNNSLDMFEEMKLYAILHKGRLHSPTAVKAADALRAATKNGAIAQGRGNESGEISLGLDADLILIDMDAPHLNPRHNELSNIVYSARGQDVFMTMVRGEILYENNEFKTIDIERAIFEATAAAKKTTG